VLGYNLLKIGWFVTSHMLSSMHWMLSLRFLSCSVRIGPFCLSEAHVTLWNKMRGNNQCRLIFSESSMHMLPYNSDIFVVSTAFIKLREKYSFHLLQQSLSECIVWREVPLLFSLSASSHLRGPCLPFVRVRASFYSHIWSSFTCLR